MVQEKDDVFERFQEVYEKRHQYARDWQAKNGGKVLGSFCTYVPIEIIYAAGMLPVRVLGNHQNDRISDEYIFGAFCPFCHDVLNQGLRGRYDYLDGIVHARTCDHIETAFHNWGIHVPTGLNHFIFMPGHIRSPKRSMPLLIEEYKDFIGSLEKLSGEKITDDALNEAIEIVNKNRRLQREIYEFRKLDDPAITGEEAMKMVVSGQLMDIREHNDLLEKLLGELPNRKLDRETGARLMLVGSENDDIDFIHMVEGLGSTVVIEESCSGSRYFWDDVIPGDDPLAAIASRYIERRPCPAFDYRDRVRPKLVPQLAEEYKVEGAILYGQKFCTPHEYDIPQLKRILEEMGIPALVLEFEITVPLGAFQTRVEALLEMLLLDI
jgi:benzoyl-CoA reductase subunit C